MPTPKRKLEVWAIVFFAVLGVLAITYSSWSWGVIDPAELSAWSSGRSLTLPGWGWIAVGYVVGVGALAVAAWALRRRRRWR